MTIAPPCSSGIWKPSRQVEQWSKLTTEPKDVDHIPLIVDLGDDDPRPLVRLWPRPQALWGSIFFHRPAEVGCRINFETKSVGLPFSSPSFNANNPGVKSAGEALQVVHFGSEETISHL